MAGSGIEFGGMSATVPLTRQPQIELAAALVPHLLLRLHTYTFSLTPQPHLTSFSSLLHSHQRLRLLHSHATILIRRCFGSKRRRHRHQAATAQTPALREGETRRAETSLVPGKGPQPCPGPSSLCQLLHLSSAHHFFTLINNSGACYYDCLPFGDLVPLSAASTHASLLHGPSSTCPADNMESQTAITRPLDK